METPKMVVFCYQTVRSTRGQTMAVHSTQCQNRAVCKGGGGVTLTHVSAHRISSAQNKSLAILQI